MVKYYRYTFVLSLIFTTACLTTIFQFGACAQAAPQEPVQTENTVAVAEPQVALPQPTVELVTKPHEQKLQAVKFSDPDALHAQAPRKFKASAYSINGRTRSGAKTQAGTLAADPRVLPLGTVVQVNAGKYSGVYTVHDTGGAIKGNRVDVWFPSRKEARRFGRRSVKLVVLKYPGQNAPRK